jgi:pectate lyase-like protein
MKLFKTMIFCFALYAPSTMYCEWIEYTADTLPDYIDPPVMEPIPDGVDLKIPANVKKNRLASIGYLDVTDTPYNADPTGKKDCTKALQEAINFARDHQFVVFFPAGKYTISDTLVLRHGMHMRSHRKTTLPCKYKPCMMVGSRKGQGTKGYSRPVIYLKNNSKGFKSKENPKYIIESRIYAVKRWKANPEQMAWASLMNTMFVNIDITIGKGNSGAIGMLWRSCEGAGVQDCTIDARNGYIGMEGAAGNGGSWTNLRIIGGEIGIDMRGWTPPTPTMETIYLIDQRKTALICEPRGSLTAVGVFIRSDGPGPVIIGQKRVAWAVFDGGINLIDSIIIFNKKGNNIAIQQKDKKSVYLNNVYVMNAQTVIADDIKGKSDGWVHVKEYARGYETKERGYTLVSSIYIDGKKISSPFIGKIDNVSPPKDLIKRHHWGETFPNFEMENACNVKNAPYNAVGDSFKDDTIALQKAIDENEIVFLPRGYYRISKTIKLRKNTKLIGVAQHLSVIVVRDPRKSFADPKNPMPMIETVNDADAQTMIAFCGIRTPKEYNASYKGKYHGTYSLKWMCGRKSIFCSVDLHPIKIFGFIGEKSKDIKNQIRKHPSVLITGNGGGRWYNYHTSDWSAYDETGRGMLIQNTIEPLRFYNFEPQHIRRVGALAEIVNSKNIILYGMKTECNATFLIVRDSSNIQLFGHGGIGNAVPGGAEIIFNNCNDFLISNLVDQANLKARKTYYRGRDVRLNITEYHSLFDIIGKKTKKIPPLERPVLYKRGSPKAIW